MDELVIDEVLSYSSVLTDINANLVMQNSIHITTLLVLSVLLGAYLVCQVWGR